MLSYARSILRYMVLITGSFVVFGLLVMPTPDGFTREQVLIIWLLFLTLAVIARELEGLAAIVKRHALDAARVLGWTK